ncbi:PEGA domain-containing protein [Salinisphaera sp. RV14]|uniref:PEGA domain-containing protein n=1 Tax=unclassified Salinisphaera TaxID=2649847 RepID=UPI003F84B3A6
MSLSPRLVASLAIVTTVAGLSGCATVTHGTHQDVSVKSTPSKATVFVDGKQVGTTPMKATISRHAHQTVKLTHDGYQPYMVHFKHHVSVVTGGNVLVGGLLGGALDAADGANGYNTPKKLDVQLVPLSSAQNTAPAATAATSDANSHS